MITVQPTYGVAYPEFSATGVVYVALGIWGVKS